MHYDRLLQALAEQLHTFESRHAGAGWHAPIAVQRIAVCDLSDFPEQGAVPEVESRGWVAAVHEHASGHPVASAVMSSPAEAPEVLERELDLASHVCRAALGHDVAMGVEGARAFRGSVVSAILATHAPPDTRILSVALRLGEVEAHFYLLCDGKARHWLEEEEDDSAPA